MRCLRRLWPIIRTFPKIKNSRLKEGTRKEECIHDTPAEAGALPKEKAQKDEAAPEVSSQERKEISKAK